MANNKLAPRNHIKVFVASTVYNFEHQLKEIYELLDNYGYDVLMSHKGTILLDSRESNLTNCINSVKECDVFVGFIRPDYGSGVLGDNSKSIVHQEFETAYKRKIPRFVLADYRVVFTRDLFKDSYFVKKDKSKKYNLELESILFNKKIMDGRCIRMYNEAIKDRIKPASKRTGNWEKLTALEASFEDLNIKEITKTIQLAEEISRGKKLPSEPEEFLNYFQILDFNSVKNGAMILYGKNPTRFLPQCVVRISVMPYGKTGHRYEDTLIIEDNLFIAFERIHKYFEKELPVISDFKTNKWERKDRKKYPMEALDEAIVNALVHRDYGDVSGEVRINIYTDKIEVINSGEIPAGILKGKNKFEFYHPVFRNPMIAQMFFLRGLMEKMGRGLQMIKDKFKESDLKTPEWITRDGYTTLKLYGFSEPVKINKRMVSFLEKINIGEEFIRKDYEKASANKISGKTARIDISKLVNGGWIDKIENGPATSYIKTGKELPEITG